MLSWGFGLRGGSWLDVSNSGVRKKGNKAIYREKRPTTRRALGAIPLPHVETIPAARGRRASRYGARLGLASAPFAGQAAR
jgi:hypothetical protein